MIVYRCSRCPRFVRKGYFLCKGCYNQDFKNFFRTSGRN